MMVALLSSGRSSRIRLLLLAAAVCLVDRDRDDHDAADQHVLQVRVDCEQRQGIRDEGHQQNAEERTEDRAFAAGEADAADQQRGDDTELNALPQRSRRGAVARGSEDTGQRREKADDHNKARTRTW